MSTESDRASVRALVLAVFETNGRLVEAGNRLVRPVGLTTAWWQVLGALGYSSAPLPVAHVARKMGLTRQAVQRVVDLLAARGYVGHRPNPHHQRAKLIVLTPEGRAALSGAEEASAPIDRAIFDRIGARRLEEAAAVLREMNDVIARMLEASAGDVSPVLEGEAL